MSARRRDTAFIILRMTGEQGVRDHEVDDRIPEELEALVMTGCVLGMFVQPAGVRERLFKQSDVADGEAEACRKGPGGGHDARRPGPLRRRALVDVVDGVLDGADLLRVLVRDLRPELLFEAHDELDQVERVGVQVVDERRLGLDLILVGAELLDDDLLEALVRGCH